MQRPLVITNETLEQFKFLIPIEYQVKESKPA